jgi:hypothetical protein
VASTSAQKLSDLVVLAIVAAGLFIHGLENVESDSQANEEVWVEFEETGKPAPTDPKPNIPFISLDTTRSYVPRHSGRQALQVQRAESTGRFQLLPRYGIHLPMHSRCRVLALDGLATTVFRKQSASLVTETSSLNWRSRLDHSKLDSPRSSRCGHL